MELAIGERARLIGYVPQAHAGTFAYSVRDVVLMGRTAHQGLFAKPSAADRLIAISQLSALGIEHLAEQPYTMISGGERQLVLIARAMAQEPHFVVLDEPTASLDFGNQGKVMHQVRALTSRGIGVLFTTHDPNQALRHSDRVLLLANGTVLADGSPEKTLTRDRLEELYRAPVESIWDAERSQIAFLPS
jgi:iron complex transport system ATP-binding protein